VPDTDDPVVARLGTHRQPTIDDDRRLRFERLAGVVYEPLQRYIRRRADPAIVDDALSDTLVVLWRRLDDVPMAEPLPWCYGVARRCLANARRSSQRQERLVARLAADPAPTMVDRTDPSSNDDELHQALARLSDADRELVRLWAWEGLEPREIAVAVDSTPNAISIRLYRVRRRLADELGKDPTTAGHDTSTRHADDESEED
jgi:RNA polymerase sigma-70 factor (ECF subfamily)